MTYLARDIMNADVIAVPSTMDLRDLGKLFLQKSITGAPVIDAEGRLEGVISQTDLVYYNLTRGDELVFDSHFYQNARVDGQHIPAGFQFEDFNSGCVADVMTPVVHAVRENATVESVARMMTRKHIHRVVVQKGRKPVGMISALDVLRVYGKLGGSSAESAKSAKKPRKTASSRRRVAVKRA